MPTSTAKPDSTLWYRNSRGTWCVSWRINPVVGEDISLMDCELQIDTVSSFNSVNLKSYIKNSPEVINYQNGYFFKAFVFTDRDLLQDVTYHYRVRINSSDYISDWSDTNTFTLTKCSWKTDRDLLVGLLPDDNVWIKEGITTSGKIIEGIS